jgi:ComF family protein
MRHPPRFERARAALLYEGVGRDLILAFKLADRTWLAPTLGQWMARAGKELLTDADIIAPVPLHRRRLYTRRFNQSVLLAKVIGRDSGLPVIPDLLLRTRATKPQTRLSGAERRRNVRGAFLVRSRYEAQIENRRVLLIDDVLTTGATVAACALAISRAGGGPVDVLTLARTADPATSSH